MLFSRSYELRAVQRATKAKKTPPSEPEVVLDAKPTKITSQLSVAAEQAKAAKQKRFEQMKEQDPIKYYVIQVNFRIQRKEREQAINALEKLHEIVVKKSTCDEKMIAQINSRNAAKRLIDKLMPLTQQKSAENILSFLNTPKIPVSKLEEFTNQIHKKVLDIFNDPTYQLMIQPGIEMLPEERAQTNFTLVPF